MKSFIQFMNEKEEYLYHGTMGANVPNIIKHGLLPGKKVNKSNWPEYSNPDKVYLIKDRKKAMSWARSGFDNNHKEDLLTGIPHSIRVIRILRSLLNPNRLDSDRNFVRKSVEYSGPIPKKAINWKGKGLHGWTDRYDESIEYAEIKIGKKKHLVQLSKQAPNGLMTGFRVKKNGEKVETETKDAIQTHLIVFHPKRITRRMKMNNFYGELEPINEDRYLYHGTRGVYVPDIIKRGIVPAKEAGHINYPSFTKPKRVYVTPSRADAQDWADSSGVDLGHSWRIIRILKDKLDKKKLRPDYNFRDSDSSNMEYFGSIPPDAIDWKGKKLHGRHE